MGTTSTKSKQRWNTEHYTQIKISVAPELASSFKSACAAADVSMAGQLSKFMADYIGVNVVEKTEPKAFNDYSTRGKRRAAVKRILAELEQIKKAEERFVNNAPENLQSAPIYEVADESVSALDESIDQLSSAY